MSRRAGEAPSGADGPDGAAPVIATVQMDAGSADFFQRLRTAHFPPALDRVPAHLTLFHALPGPLEAEIVEHVAAVAAREAPFPMRVAGPVPLGRGVAFRIESERLAAVRAAIAAPFRERLTGQDRQRFRPHVTVQNKVTPEAARRTLADLAAAFEPFEAIAEGVQLWHYAGGPWRPAGAIAFAAPAP